MNRVFSLAIITSFLVGCGGGGGGSGSSSSSGSATSGSGSSGSVNPSSVTSDAAGEVSNGVTNIGRKKALEDSFWLNEKFHQMTPSLSYAADKNAFSLKHDTGLLTQKVRVLGVDGDTRLDLQQIFKFSMMGISFEPELAYSNIQAKSASGKLNVDLFALKMMAGKSFSYKDSVVDFQSGIFRDTSALLNERYGVLLRGNIKDHEKQFGVSYGVMSFQDRMYQDVKLEFSIIF